MQEKHKRIERDSMGEIAVDADKLWGAQTQRSLENFKIGGASERMPLEIIHAYGILKAAAARANARLIPEKMTAEKCRAICDACEMISRGELDDHFPLVIFQTGSGTQTNMNVNEVISHKANDFLRDSGYDARIHPNDDANMSQSSNDTFPSVMHVSAYLGIKRRLLPALEELTQAFLTLEAQNEGIIKCGRTHLQDATPIKFSQEISGWRASLERDAEHIRAAMAPLLRLSLGATAVGTGLGAPEGFDVCAAEELSLLTGEPFITEDNKFHALTSRSELVFAHGALKALAADLFKIANDVRWLASGPRTSLGEISIPQNEPGSSIMPGKVNPTQCEAITMIAVQVMANDTAVGMGASQGNFELNVFLPVSINAFLQSVRLLADGMLSFTRNCVTGIRANEQRMRENLERSLMLVTALNTRIGYDAAARIAKTAHEQNITLREACLSLGLLSAEEFDSIVIPEEMV